MIYEKIMALCKARNISVRRLERETGLGNGVIAGWKHGYPRVDKLLAVADYFGVTLDELVRETQGRRGETGGSVNTKPPTRAAGKGRGRASMKTARTVKRRTQDVR